MITVSASVLRDELKTSDLMFLRAIMADPITGASDDENLECIADTINFDIDKCGSDHSSYLPHTLPPPADLAQQLNLLGVNAETKIVVYDNRGIYSAPRLWWMLKALQYKHVRILDGGLPAWHDIHGSFTEPKKHSPSPHIDAIDAYELGWFVGAETVFAAINTDIQIIDARSSDRYQGKVDEPRAGLMRGHIPSSKNIPFADLLESGQFKSKEQLMEVFLQADIDLSRPIICSCGSGITACIVGVAAYMCGASRVSVYDGSWSEWGTGGRFPIER